VLSHRGLGSSSPVGNDVKTLGDLLQPARSGIREVTRFRYHNFPGAFFFFGGEIREFAFSRGPSMTRRECAPQWTNSCQFTACFGQSRRWRDSGMDRYGGQFGKRHRHSAGFRHGRVLESIEEGVQQVFWRTQVPKKSVAFFIKLRQASSIGSAGHLFIFFKDHRPQS